MYLQSRLDETSSGLGACAVPASVTLRRLVCTAADRTAIGVALALGPDATAAEVRTIITDAVRRPVVLIARAAAAAGEAMRLRFRDAFGTAPDSSPVGAPPDKPGIVVPWFASACAAPPRSMSEGDIEFVCLTQAVREQAERQLIRGLGPVSRPAADGGEGVAECTCEHWKGWDGSHRVRPT